MLHAFYNDPMETSFFIRSIFTKGYTVLNGLKTSSNSYGKEVLTYAINRFYPEASWSKQKILPLKLIILLKQKSRCL